MGEWSQRQQDVLLGLAERAVRAGVETGRRLEVGEVLTRPFPEEPRATFVTLHVAQELNGCLGTIEPQRHICHDVAHNAYGAALEDPRFPELASHQLDDVVLHISVLSPLEPLEVDGEQHLCEVLRPGVDGLVLEAGEKRGTFLPSVWEKIPDPRAFVLHLKRKAKIPLDAWPPNMRVYHYQVDEMRRD